MARTALDDLIDIYREAQLALIKIITGKTGAGTKTYYNSILKQTEALLNRLSAQTGRYINTEIPKAYEKALEETYAYFQKNGLQMNRPEMFAQIHSDAVSELAAEMQHHINEGISSAGRRVMRYADTARDNVLRQNGLRASAVKIASGQTVRDMQKYLTQTLSEDGFLTVQYGSGKYAYQVGLDSYAGLVARSTTREAGNLAREKQLTANGYDLVTITKHTPTCELCARVQGRVFSISGKDKRFPPLSEAFPSGYRNVHPNCRCVAVPWIEELQSPEELRAAVAKGSQPLRDERSAKEKALYSKEQAERRQMRADRLQFERYKVRLGSDAPKTFSQFRRIKNEDDDRWESLQKEYRQKFEKVHNSSIDNFSESGIIESNKELYPDTLAGVKRGNPMTFEEADTGNVNPNYGGKGYDTNCQSCTIVNEARRRGYDVEVLPNTPNSMAEKLSHQYTMAWINPETGKKPEYIVDKSKDTPKKYLEFMHSTIKPDERYIIGFTWKGKGNSGHIVNLDINENGELRIKDNQRGTKERSEWIGDKAILKYLKQMKWSETLSGYKMAKVPKMLRIDNLQFEPDVAKKIMKEREK